jgi:TRAP-type C4-dicarboxylate transport system permease small subunit
VAWIGAAATGFMVILLMWAIIARRVFNSPLLGASELTAFALVIIVFCALGYDTLEHEKMLVEIVIERFSKRAQHVIVTIMHFFSIVILAILGQQMVVHAERVRGFSQTTKILMMPLWVFEYVAAIGIFLLLIVYIRHFINDLVTE